MHQHSRCSSVLVREIDKKDASCRIDLLPYGNITNMSILLSALPSSFPVDAHLVFQSEAIPVRIKNISTCGASVFSGRPISATKQVALVLAASSGCQFSCEGTTVYSVERERDVWETGIRFGVLSKESHDFVMALMLHPASPK